MRSALVIAVAAFLATLGGCAIVPAGPGVYAAPPHSATIVVRPGFVHHGHYHRRPRHHWR
jgi:hypothetical protein